MLLIIIKTLFAENASSILLVATITVGFHVVITWCKYFQILQREQIIMLSKHFTKNYAYWFFFNMSSPIVGSSNTTNRGLWNKAIINDIIRFSLKLIILQLNHMIIYNKLLISLI